MLGSLAMTRSPARDRVLVLVSLNPGRRATAMAALLWAMGTDAAEEVAAGLHVPNRARKGKTGAAPCPCTPPSRRRWSPYRPCAGTWPSPRGRFSARRGGGGLSPATVRLWCPRLETSLKRAGCASPSGRRTVMTRAARNVSHVGGRLRDVQELASQTSLAMTQRAIAGETEAKRTRVARL